MRIVQQALTFDDVLLVPASSEVLPNQAVLKTRLTRTIDLNIPLISAAMDTVTEARLAIAIAQEGGIGIVHKNLSIELQASEVAAVKKYDYHHPGNAGSRCHQADPGTQDIRTAGDR